MKREREGTKMSNTEIANNIIDQLGGAGRLCAMLNVKAFLAVESGLSFQFQNRAGKPNSVTIKLNPRDEYDVKFHRIARGGMSIKPMGDVEGVYAGELKRIIEEKTGLYLSL